MNYNKKTMQKYMFYLIDWLKKEVQRTNSKGLVFGLSGGIDSALVGALCQKAVGDQALALMMPIEVFDDLNDAKLISQTFKLKNKLVDLTSVYHQLSQQLDLKKQLAKINIMPRLRMTTLYAYSQENNYLVVGTSNNIEWKLGYFTKHGDVGVDIQPIIHLNKTQVRQMASLIGVPQKIIDKAPSAGLYVGQSDEKELGFTYHQAEEFFKNAQNLKLDLKTKIENQIKKTNHKRQPILVPKDLQQF